MSTQTSAETVAALRAAVEYYFPVYEMARTRYMMLHQPKNPARREVNVLFNQRALATHKARAVTTPNTDTLYSSVWLDLKASPVFLSIPPIAGRYWSIAMMDVFTNNFAMLGSRMGDGAQGRSTEVVIAGPDEDLAGIAALYRQRHGQPMRADQRIIRSPSNDVWMLARWLVDSVQDSLEAHKIQDGTHLSALRADAASWVQTAQPETRPGPRMFLETVNDMLARNPVPADEMAMTKSWHALGFDGQAGAWERLDASMRDLWDAQFSAIMSGFGQGLMGAKTIRDGWTIPDPATGNFGRNYALRAIIALGGLGALEPAEAVYMTAATDANGQALSGAHRYRLRLPEGGIQARAFWSLTMYELMPDGRLFFIDNPLHRYALGDRSQGISRREDGSFDILMQAEAPEEAADMAAWLPAPKGDFRVVLRVYVPSDAVINGVAPLPRIERLA